MRRVAVFAIVLVACGQESEDRVSRLDRRRAALGLSEEPLSLKRSMGLLKKRDAEQRLSSERDPERLRDLALRVENLLGRVRGELRSDVGVALASATKLAEAPGPVGARALLEACAACHVKHREER